MFLIFFFSPPSFSPFWCDFFFRFFSSFFFVFFFCWCSCFGVLARVVAPGSAELGAVALPWPCALAAGQEELEPPHRAPHTGEKVQAVLQARRGGRGRGQQKGDKKGWRDLEEFALWSKGLAGSFSAGVEGGKGSGRSRGGQGTCLGALVEIFEIFYSCGCKCACFDWTG